MKDHRGFIWLLASMYLAGLTGLSFEKTRALFQALTPFHLLTSFGVLVLFHKDKSRPFYIFLLICILTGYLIEVAGVKTGRIFGSYQYLDTLGRKVFDVPPLIGVNWFLLVCSMGVVVEGSRLTGHGALVKAASGAFGLVLFDGIAEPVAISLDMWTWFGKEPPLQNYIAWFFVAFFLLYLFFRADFGKKNPVAFWLLIFQVMFFTLLNVMMYYEN